MALEDEHAKYLSLFWREILSFSSKAVGCTNIRKNIVQNKRAISVSLAKCAEACDPQRIVS